jgi:thymidylate synthase (FAD)
MLVQRIEQTNDDLSIVNIARVSMNKWADKLDMTPNTKGVPRDVSLINYLVREKHISTMFHQRFTFRLSRWELDLFRIDKPELLMGAVWEPDGHNYYYLRHSFWGWVNLIRLGWLDNRDIEGFLANQFHYAGQACGLRTSETPAMPVALNNPQFIDVSLRINAPIFIMEHLYTHKMLAKNRVSRRYVEDNPEFTPIHEWSLRPSGSIKQGSGNPHPDQDWAAKVYAKNNRRTKKAYNKMLDAGIAPEQARINLPVSMETQAVMTASVWHWAKFLKLRLDSHTQKETRLLAEQVFTEVALNAEPVAYGLAFDMIEQEDERWHRN